MRTDYSTFSPRFNDRTSGATLRALSSGRVIAFHLSLARALHSVNAGLLLSQMLYRTSKTNHPDGWFAWSSTRIMDETMLTRREQESARVVMRSAGVIEERRHGMPAVMQYRVDFDGVARLLAQLPEPPNDPSMAETYNQECTDSSMAENAKQDWRKTPNKIGGNVQTLKRETGYKTDNETGDSPPDPRFDPSFANAHSGSRTVVANDENSLTAWADIILGSGSQHPAETTNEPTRTTATTTDDTRPCLEKKRQQPLARPSENESQQPLPAVNPAKPWLTRKPQNAPQRPGASRQGVQNRKVGQRTAPRIRSPRNQSEAPPERKPNKYAEVIDAIRAAGIGYTPISRDAGAVKRCEADATTIAAAYVAAYRREWGGNGVQGNLSVWYICDRINDYVAWDMQGRPKSGGSGAGRYPGNGPQQGRPGDRYRMLGKLRQSEYENIERMKERQRQQRAEIERELAEEDAAGTRDESSNV